MNKALMMAIGKALEKAAKWFLKREHGKAAETINENRLVQVRNPRSGRCR